MAKTSRPRAKKQDTVIAEDEAKDVDLSLDTTFEAEVSQEPVRAADAPEVLDAVILEDEVTSTSASPDQSISDEATKEPETMSPPRQEAPAPQAAGAKAKQGGFLGMVIGGVIAAAAGYGVATYFPSQAPAGVDTSFVEQLQSEIASQADAVTSMQDSLSKLAELESRLTAVESREPGPAVDIDFTPIEAAIASLNDRISALEALPVGVVGEGADATTRAALEAMQAEIEALKGQGEAAAATVAAAAAEAEARLAEAEAQAAALKAEAETTARKAVQAAAVGRIQAALDTGAPFVSALVDLEGVDIPTALTTLAESGAPTIRSLSETFPAAAREALDASRRATMGDSLSERLSSFLETATGSRSLAPREGTDPDAVLSRAEAAVLEGDVAAALAEIKTLPEAGQVPLAEWVALAQTRLDAMSALAGLTSTISE